MKCGTPVIVGNRTSLPEVVGDAGLTVDPFDVDAIAGAIRKLINDSVASQELSQRARKGPVPSLARNSSQTLRVYQEVARPSILRS
jgi:glycosyltransferase involved in cell wall biosynthesis